ncbi:AAA family ATPase [Nocardia sp. CA-135953]|uniref:AAA family ATPase n=1 Tax=Nocardia sp. CA-135953 TaxID=3239978 RepID=UPI003D9658B4
MVTHLDRVGGLTLAPGVTFLVGENGSGKSTLIEAIAVAAGMNPEGGSQNYRFTTRSTESSLGEHLVLRWGTSRPRSRFFLRAESFYNVATETELLGPQQLAAVGGVSLHQRSHGESFVDLMRHRFYPNGLYLLDEPEAALSPRGCMAVLARMSELVAQQCRSEAAPIGRHPPTIAIWGSAARPSRVGVGACSSSFLASLTAPSARFRPLAAGCREIAVMLNEEICNTIRTGIGRSGRLFETATVTYVAVVIGGAYMVLTLVADIVNPIQLFR